MNARDCSADAFALVPLIADLAPGLRHQLLHVSRVQALASDQLFVQRGEAATHWYVVLEGSVKLVLHGVDGREKVVARVACGRSFGEELVFMDSPVHPAAALAATAARVLAVPTATTAALLRRSPDACVRAMGELGHRLHGFIRQLEDVSLASAPARLVTFLDALAGDAARGPVQVTLPDAKQLVACRLAMKPETLSRTLREFASRGLLSVEGRVVHIRDLDALRAAV